MSGGKWYRHPKSDLTIVFVHGINSGEDCWINPDTKAFWPKLLQAETDIESVGVYSFSYRTGLLTGSYSLEDVVDALKEYARIDNILDHGQVIFVCHSMGGIVVRRFLVNQQAYLLEQGLRSVGLFLVASPSMGSHYANLISPISRSMGHTQAQALKFSQQNIWLNGLDNDFVTMRDKSKLMIVGKELVEDLPIMLKGIFQAQIVPPFSGARYFGDPFKVPGTDHFTIARPESETSIQHRLLLRFIKDFKATSNHESENMNRSIVYKMDLPDDRSQILNALYEWFFTAYPENKLDLIVKENSLIIGSKEVLTVARTPIKLYNCSIEFDMRIIEDYGNLKDWAGVRIRGFNDNINSGYLIYLRNSGDVEIFRAGNIIGRSQRKFVLPKDDLAHIRIDAFQYRISVWINNELYITSEDKMFGMEGYVYLHTHKVTSQFSNLVIYDFTKL